MTALPPPQGWATAGELSSTVSTSVSEPVRAQALLSHLIGPIYVLLLIKYHVSGGAQRTTGDLVQEPTPNHVTRNGC